MKQRMLWMAFAFLFGWGARAAAEGPVGVLLTGQFHGEEVTARSGERWLGLTRGRAGYFWKWYRIAVSPVEDGLVDAPGEKTGGEVSVRGGEPVLLLKGLDLQRVKVRTAMSQPAGRQVPEKAGFPLE